jgi:hypothetical protein
MRFRKRGWIHRLRERPPAWPWSEGEVPAGRERWLRDPEPFEDAGSVEPYPGATVLDDLAGSEEETSSLRILARYTVVRVLLLGTSGTLAAPALRTERRVARQHIALLPSHDWERLALDRLCEMSREAPGPDIVDAAIIAAECAAKRGHAMGAFSLYRAGYELAVEHGWWDPAARAARGAALLARLGEASRSTRLWNRRAGVLERRAARAEGETGS